MDDLQWYAGNLLCKGLMMIRTGGYILSSLLLVVLSIDRSDCQHFELSILEIVKIVQGHHSNKAS